MEGGKFLSIICQSEPGELDGTESGKSGEVVPVLMPGDGRDAVSLVEVA